jgi:NAD(P)-dependent dehydrogenase (short-subunit alcohol dehydrogenase family)
MGKRIVITGVARGLGRAMCDALIQQDHTIIGCARSPEAIELLQSRYGSAHTFSVTDISDPNAVIAWAQQARATVGTPDLIINNAGLINANANLWEVPPEEFRAVCEVNLLGTYAVIRAFLPAMLEQGRGGVVNFSSTWGHSTSPEVAPYCATKWGIEGLTQALAQELPSGMFAVAFNPGVINTDMLQSCFGASAATYPSAQEWAEDAVPFLLQLDAKDNGASVRAPHH